MTNQLTSLQCPGCGGLLQSLDARVWQCAYCESRYVLLGEETPVPGLARVVGGSKVADYLYDDCWPMHIGDAGPEFVQWTGAVSPLQVAQRKAQMAIDSFGRKFGRARLRAMPGPDLDIDPSTGTILPAYNDCKQFGAEAKHALVW